MTERTANDVKSAEYSKCSAFFEFCVAKLLKNIKEKYIISAMAENMTPEGPEKKENGAKRDNAFVRAMKAVFVRDIKTKLVALGISVGMWLLAVGLGVSSVQYPDSVGFFEGFGRNIAAEFSSVFRGFVSVLDILLLFAIVYLAIYLLRKNNAAPIIKFFVITAVVCVVLSSTLLSFPVLGSIFGNGILLLIIVILIMYPQELRRMMWKLASRAENAAAYSADYDCTEEELREAVDDIVRAVLNMSKDNLGALIIITTQTVPKHILESGTELGAKLSQPLIECLFNTNADLHDGAVFIRGNKILAAGCFLTLSQNQTLPKELGTRHRAALGVTEQYNVLAIVVSEETGIISVARDGKLDRYYDAVMLTDVIEQVYGLKASGGGKPKKKRGRKLL